jgi:tetratricopeptide (TPR) repeat protein
MPNNRSFFIPTIGKIFFIMIFFWADVSADSGLTCYLEFGSHPCLSADNPVSECTAALEENPYSLETRLSLCEAHIRVDNNPDSITDAYIVLKKGEEQCGSNRFTCQQYKLAQSMLLEENDDGRRDLSITTQERCDYGRELCKSRLSSGLGLKGCDQALICNSEDGELYYWKAQKLFTQNRPAEAVIAFRKAYRMSPENTEIGDKLAAAEKVRLNLVDQCLKGLSLEDCNRALLADEPDEFDVHYQRGQLLLKESKYDAAIQAFINAQDADPKDAGLATDLLRLLGTVNLDKETDILMLRARARALSATGKTDNAIIAFRQAQKIDPMNPEISKELAAARTQRQRRIEKQCLSRNDVTSCEAMILPGEPDERLIRRHIASLTKPPPVTPVKPVPTKEIAEKPVAMSEANQVPEPPILYSNRAFIDGRTY